MTTKMQAFFILCVMCYSIATAFASDTEVEILIPNIALTDVENYNNSALVSTDESTTSTDSENVNPSALMGKHESLLTCPQFILDPGEYEIFPNGSLLVEVMLNLMLNESHYIILENDTVKICTPHFEEFMDEFEEYAEHTMYVTFVGLGISMVSLLIHLIVFTIVPDLKNLPGCNLAALCASLFCGYLFFIVITTEVVQKYKDFCVAAAFLTHFFLLSSVIWMSIMSYDVYTALLRATGSLRTSSTQFSVKRFGTYCLGSFGIALLFAVSSLLTDILDGVPIVYKPDFELFCWFRHKIPLTIFFAGPVFALTCLNFIFFGLSAYTLHFNKMEKDKEDQKSLLKRRYLMYFRLSVIMGITWFVGIIAVIVDAEWLWYVFVLLNTFQGFFIFIAFTCSKKVKKYFREKYFGARRGSEQTLSPTFQSYCFYANSIEKDMDKIVENGKDKIDTIVIHL